MMLYPNIEAELLIYCLRTHFNSCTKNSEQFNALLNRDINWSYFLSIVSHNRVVPLVWKALSDISVPKSVAIGLQNTYHQIALHHATHINELKDLLKLFKDNNISAIPFKGPALGKVYNNAALREWSELDIIIPKQDIERAANLLLSNGYVFADKMPFTELLVQYHSCQFTRESGTQDIDVHWQLADAKDQINFPMERLWEECSDQPFFGIETPLLDPENLILSTCIHHGCRNCWNELRFICDMAVLLKANQQLDWGKTLSSADRLRIRRSLLVGLFLANQLLEIDMPTALRSALAKDHQIKNVGLRIFQGLFEPYKEENIFFTHNIKMSLKDNVYTKLLFLFKPKFHDKKMIHLPPYLSFLYYFIRFFRMLNQFGGKIYNGG